MVLLVTPPFLLYLLDVVLNAVLISDVCFVFQHIEHIHSFWKKYFHWSVLSLIQAASLISFNSHTNHVASLLEISFLYYPSIICPFLLLFDHFGISGEIFPSLFRKNWLWFCVFLCINSNHHIELELMTKLNTDYHPLKLFHLILWLLTK